MNNVVDSPEGAQITDRIRSILPPTGTWYCVTENWDHRSWIERVICWALVENPGEVDHLMGIGDRGLTIESDGGDAYFVFGPDKSPTGATWDEVYGLTTPNRALVREITALLVAR